jgi:hypothetical protein
MPAPDPSVERRAATPIGDTGSVPQGTMLTVPAAAPTGGISLGPIVAVNTTHWYADPAFLTTLGGAFLALEPVIEDAFRQSTFNWKSFTLACILALGAFFRNRFNTVVK